MNTNVKINEVKNNDWYNHRYFGAAYAKYSSYDGRGSFIIMDRKMGLNGTKNRMLKLILKKLTYNREENNMAIRNNMDGFTYNITLVNFQK